MKIKEGFELRDVCGEHIIIASGRENIDFSKVISLNESAALLWRSVEGKEFSAQDLVDELEREYDATRDKLEADVEDLLRQWHEIGMIED